MLSGISEFWRKNISANEAIELANLLRALRKVAGHLGTNTGVIEYTGMSNKGGACIVIDPEIVMGEYPVPYEKVDNLVGLVTHESLHQIEWSDHVWKLLEPGFKQMTGLSLARFQKIIHTGEDIYVDLIADQKIFGLYVQKARKKAIEHMQTSLKPGISSVDELIYLWWSGQYDNNSMNNRKPDYEKPLLCLKLLSEDLKSVSRMGKSVTARCEKRADIYLKTWERIKDLISQHRLIDKKIFWYSETHDPKTEKKYTHENKNKNPNPLPSVLLKDIELKLARNSIDMTSIIRSIVGYDNEDIVPTSRWDFSISAHPLIDRRLVSRLKAIFQNYACQNKVVSRGLLSGKVDTRRLYRVNVTGRCFKQNDYIPDLDWNVTLLMDASGSMRGNKWRMVENTVANIHKALKGFHNHLKAYAYFEKDGILMISQLIERNRIQSVPPSGLTASGQAIIAAGYLMPKKSKRNILIHVTDGESNLGCDVQYAVDYCRKEKIDLITLGCGYKDREEMLSQYGKSIQFLDHFGQLPRAMERLFRWTFLYGKRPNLDKEALLTNIYKHSSVSKG